MSALKCAVSSTMGRKLARSPKTNEKTVAARSLGPRLPVLGIPARVYHREYDYLAFLFAEEYAVRKAPQQGAPRASANDGIERWRAPDRGEDRLGGAQERGPQAGALVFVPVVGLGELARRGGSDDESTVATEPPPGCAAGHGPLRRAPARGVEDLRPDLLPRDRRARVALVLGEPTIELGC